MNEEYESVNVSRDDEVIFTCKTFEVAHNWLKSNGYEYTGVEALYSKYIFTNELNNDEYDYVNLYAISMPFENNNTEHKNIELLPYC